MILYCAEILNSSKKKIEQIPDGALAIDPTGLIQAIGPRQHLQKEFPQARVVRWDGSAILPGLVDTHVHFPQMYMVGRTGESLLGWLKRYTFAEESRFQAEEVARPAAQLFFQTLLSQGTTTSSVFSSSHLKTTEILFEAALHAGVRSCIGKVSMDRGAPPALLTDRKTETAALTGLISRWHGKEDRLFVSLTPRFALSCSENLLASLGELCRDDHSLRVQTHFAENKIEVSEVRKRFPKSKDYLAVYERAGLIGPLTVLAHGIHGSVRELSRIGQAGATLSHCPTSNTFLGSGLYPMKKIEQSKVRTALGTDIGGGTSFSLFHTMAEAYKVQQLLGERVSVARLFYLATQAGAEALGLGKEIGSFAVGKKADFQVIRPRGALVELSWAQARSAEEKLTTLMFTPQSQVEQIYVGGRKVYPAE